MKKLLSFNNVIKEFDGFVGNISSARIDLFRSDLRRVLRQAYKQGYKEYQEKISKDQDIFDNAG